ncbi:MAG: endolytic transglycosylase MltG [Elusimicrobiota bacterium]|jgi:UPF0755 protein|nr:endolytic transglycosylase MltG [Elusimicrobiota bacterium]
MAIKSKILIGVLAAIIIAAGIWYFNLSSKKVGFTIKYGDTAHKVADMLYDSKVIGFKEPFLAWAKITNTSLKIQPGYYEFSARDNFFTIVSALRKGSKNYIKITIPEGSNIKQIAAIAAPKLERFDPDRFIKIATDEKLEGYLMPETYFVGYDCTAEEMISIMRSEFDKKVTPEMYERAKEIGMTMEKIITLASIVEKEAMRANERAEIAGIFYNRLKKGIKLESCATVLYAMGVVKPRLTIAETKFPSPYNTYLHYGLPPGPICNPGIQAIKATLYPAKTDNLFFVASGDGNGAHIFSPNLVQHVKNKNEAKVKQQQKAQAQKTAKSKRSPAIDRKAAEEATRLMAQRQLQKSQTSKTAQGSPQGAQSQGGNSNSTGGNRR